jgi:hypothetical protein
MNKVEPMEIYDKWKIAMNNNQKCPHCENELKIVFMPSNAFFEKIGFDNGMFCSNCKVRVRLHIKNNYRVILFYLPYMVVLLWNVFVEQYGMALYGFKKLEYGWVIISIGILVIGIVFQLRNKVYVIHKEKYSNRL